MRASVHLMQARLCSSPSLFPVIFTDASGVDVSVVQEKERYPWMWSRDPEPSLSAAGQKLFCFCSVVPSTTAASQGSGDQCKILSWGPVSERLSGQRCLLPSLTAESVPRPTW